MSFHLAGPSNVSLLLRIPKEILEDIVLEVANSDILGPPTSLALFASTCKYINQVCNGDHFLGRVFKSKFDITAITRRMSTDATNSSYLASQLRIYCLALKCIRRQDIYHADLLPAFWACFCMLVENDGKNRHQIERAGLDDLVDQFVRKRLYEGSEESDRWPKDTPINSLALWLMWLTTTTKKLDEETPQRRHHICQLILPYVVLPFRYATVIVPHNHYNIPFSNTFNNQSHSVVTAHGPYPLYRNIHLHTFQHYDQNNLKINVPLISIAAKLIFFSRREVMPMMFPPHLPFDRIDAHQRGLHGVVITQSDIHELNAHKFARLVPRMPWDWRTNLTPAQLALEAQGFPQSASVKFDDDWSRWTGCINPFARIWMPGTVYTFGLLDGLWQGRLMVPDEPQYMELITSAERPTHFSDVNPVFSAMPFYMRLREYHCVDPQHPVSTPVRDGFFDDGIANAWIPNSRLHEDGNRLVIEGHHGIISNYERYIPGQANSHDEETCTGCQYRGTPHIVDRGIPGEVEDFFESVGLGREEDDDEEDADAMDCDEDDVMEYNVSSTCSGVTDIVFNGETDYKHSQAWHPFKFYGRVRSWDGLIALVRVPNYINYREYGLDRWIFTGYVIGGQNFVGTWRSIGDDVGVPTWESAFVMSRRD